MTGKKKQISPGGDRKTVTVTFVYGRKLRTLVARNRKLAYAEARRRWGDWDGEPCLSSPDTIYADLTGKTRARHGGSFTIHMRQLRDRDLYRRLGRSYAR